MLIVWKLVSMSVAWLVSLTKSLIGMMVMQEGYIRWDKEETAIVEDTHDGDGVTDAYECGDLLDPHS
jgi:hypothetical protein